LVQGITSQNLVSKILAVEIHQWLSQIEFTLNSRRPAKPINLLQDCNDVSFARYKTNAPPVVDGKTGRNGCDGIGSVLGDISHHLHSSTFSHSAHHQSWRQ